MLQSAIHSIFRRDAFIIILSVILSACVDNIVFESGNEQAIFVKCILDKTKNDQALEIKYAEDIGGMSQPIGQKVTASILSGNKQVASFSKVSDTEWVALGFSPEFNTGYTLSVDLEDGRHIEGETFFPSEFSVNFNLDTAIVIHEDGLKEKFPLLKCEISDAGLNRAYSEPRVSDFKGNVWITGRSPSGAKSRYDSQYLFTDFSEVDNFNVVSLTLSDLECFSQEGISAFSKKVVERYTQEDYFEREINSINQMYPWMDYLDYSEYCVSSHVVGWLAAMPDAPAHYKVIRLPFSGRGRLSTYVEEDKDWDGVSFIKPGSKMPVFRLVADFDASSPETTTITNYHWDAHYITLMTFNFHFVSEEYDNYLRGVYTKEIRKKAGDLGNIYDETQPYSNLSGANVVGVFGATYAFGGIPYLYSHYPCFSHEMYYEELHASN